MKCFIYAKRDIEKHGIGRKEKIERRCIENFLHTYHSTVYLFLVEVTNSHLAEQSREVLETSCLFFSVTFEVSTYWYESRSDSFTTKMVRYAMHLLVNTDVVMRLFL